MNHQTTPFEVLFFLPQLGGGGAEMNAVRLAPGLLAAGIRPVYAVARGPGSYAEFLPEGAEVVVLDTGRINSSTLRLVRASRPLADLIDRRRPDVVCPVMVSPALSALAALRRARHRPAAVLSIQNSLAVSHEQDAALRDRLELALIRRRFPAFDGVISLSQGVADELRRIVPQLAQKIDVVPNVGLPLPAQMASALAWPRHAPGPVCTILACGRLTRQKDYPTLLRAFAQLRGEGIQLNVLGQGELRATLENMARDLGIADRVTFLGFQRDPFIHMRQADIFVLSSRWEGFGNVLVEAMAMGTPVVSTDCPHGPAEIITDGRNGLLVPPGDAEALAAALQRLVDDPALRIHLGSAGEARAQDFSASRIGAAYAGLFRDIAARARREGASR
ncbi:putative glycosyltransferase [Sphingobium sp. SYK-6]|uniref:glycosyltransferase n=1 Tax=Sphingobium sp. (strain NBRC 103272 / SYK-6) TaxID=627192 RepID=UPI0002276F5D|nr:glycosyltransferase [Sphingobium sp. SYK-6]BAK66265.1 putative glycosyltransferase [Sphingobium sp. SYK-6]